MVMTKWCHSGSMPDWNPTRLMYKTAPSSEVGGFSWYFLFIATLISFIIKAVSLIMKMADYCILSWAKWRTKCLSCTQPCTEPALFIFFFVKAALSLLHSKALRGWVWGFVFSSREGGQAGTASPLGWLRSSHVDSSGPGKLVRLNTAPSWCLFLSKGKTAKKSRSPLCLGFPNR